MIFIWKNPPQQQTTSSLEREPVPSSSSENPREAAREAVKKELTKQRGNESLKLLDERTKAGMIKSIDLEKSADEQNDVTALYNFSLSTEVIPILMDAGLEITVLKSAKQAPEDLKNEVIRLKKEKPDKFKKWDATTEAAYQKLIDSCTTGKKFIQTWETEWNELLPIAIQQYGEAKALRDIPATMWGKTKEISKDTYKWVMNHKVESALIVGGVIAAGWLFKKIFGKSGADATASSESESTFSKWTKRILVGGLGLGAVVALSKIIPLEKVKDWILGLFSSEKKEDKTDGLDKAIAKKIGLEDPASLEVLKQYDYEQFMSTTGEISGAVGNKAKQIFADTVFGNLNSADLANYPKFVKDFIEERKKNPHKIAAAEEKLRKFLKDNSDNIKKIHPKNSVGNVLDGLARMGVFGNEFTSRVLAIPEDVASPALISTIIKNYPNPIEQNQVRSMTLMAFEKEKAQKENNDKLIVYLEELSKTKPEFKTKIANINTLRTNLDAKRTEFAQAIADRTPVSKLETMVGKLLEVQTEMENTTTEYYGEMKAHMPAAPYILFFATRYAMLGSRGRAAAREQIRRIFTIPGEVASQLRGNANPAMAAQGTQKQLEAANKELKEFEMKQGLAENSRQQVRQNPGTQVEWRTKIMTTDYLEKKLALEQKKASISSLSEAERLSHRPELMRLEKEYLTAYQAKFGSNIEYAKDILKEAGQDMSEREKIAFVQDLKKEKVQLRQAIKEHQTTVHKEMERLGKNSPEVKKLVEELDTLNAVYRKTTRNELSLWNSIIGENKGLRKQFSEWLSEEQKSGLVKFAKNKYGRIGVMFLLLTTTLYCETKAINEKNPARETSELLSTLGMETLQLLADVCPFTFGASDWYTVGSGKEAVTGHQVKGWDRYSRIIWGTFGALLDGASLIPAVDIAAIPTSAIVRTARATGRIGSSKKLIEAWPKIKEVAEKVGGWKKFSDHLQDYIKAGGRPEKMAHAAQMVKTAVPRLAATVMIGGITYNALYTMGDDTDDKGEEISPEVIAENQPQIS